MNDHPWTVSTCSWAEYDPRMGLAVRISLGTPRWPHAPKADATIWALCPRGWYFQAPDEEFDQHYLAQLNRYGVDHIARAFRDLTDLGSGHPLILLCFERLATSPVGCHRRLFARWWEEQTDEHIPELGGQAAPTLMEN